MLFKSRITLLTVTMFFLNSLAYSKVLTEAEVNRLLEKHFGFFCPPTVVEDGNSALEWIELAAALVPLWISYGPSNMENYPRIFFNRPLNPNFNRDGLFEGPDYLPPKWFSRKDRTHAPSSLGEKLSKSRDISDNASNIALQEIFSLAQAKLGLQVLSPEIETTIKTISDAIITLKRRIGNCGEHANLAAAWLFLNIKDTKGWELTKIGQNLLYTEIQGKRHYVYKSDQPNDMFAIFPDIDDAGPHGIMLENNGKKVFWMPINYDHAYLIVKNPQGEFTICDPWSLNGRQGTALYIGTQEKDVRGAIDNINSAADFKQLPHDKILNFFTNLYKNHKELGTANIVLWVQKVWGGNV